MVQLINGTNVMISKPHDFSSRLLFFHHKMVGYSIIVQTIIQDFCTMATKNKIWCKKIQRGIFQKNVQKVAIFRTQIHQIY
jgi:hypothetical protein